MNLSSMFSRLRPERLFTRLVLVFILIFVFGAGGLSLHVIQEETELSRKREADHATKLAQHMATMIEETNDHQGHEEIIHYLQAISPFHHVLEIVIYGESGTVLGKMTRNANGVPSYKTGTGNAEVAPPEDRFLIIKNNDRYLTLWAPILDKASAGWVKMDYSLDEVSDFHMRILKDTLLDFFLILLISSISIFFLFRRPVRAIGVATKFAAELHDRQGEVISLESRTKEFVDLENALNSASRELSEHEDALAETSEMLETVLENMADGVVTIDSRGIIQNFNSSAERIFGYSAKEAIGCNVSILMPDNEGRIHDHYVDRYNRTGEAHVVGMRREFIGERKNGETFPLSVTLGEFIFRGDPYFVGSIRDETERKHAEQELIRSRESLGTAQRIAGLGSWEWNIVNDEISWSPEARRIFGLNSDDGGQTYQSAMDRIYPDDKDAVAKIISQALEDGESYQVEHRIVHPDGTIRVVQEIGEVDFTMEGKPFRIKGTIHDITERSKMEQALRESEERYSLALQGANEGIWDWNYKTGVLFMSSRYRSILGYEDEGTFMDIADWVDGINPAQLKFRNEALDAHLRGETDIYSAEYQMRNAENHYRWVSIRGKALRDENGEVYRIAGSMTDVTDRKNAEVHAQHSQRMEAVGQLASGIAHEFNNLLVAIGGFSRMASSRIDDKDRVTMCLEEIAIASDRAAELTSQLLTYSRKQEVRAEPVRVHKVVKGLERMLTSVLGANIEFKLCLSDEWACVNVDPVQLSQVITNLVINARDAMPDGGVLTISTRVVDCEEDAVSDRLRDKSEFCSCISVSDTGTGIEEETMKHLFEPFFTTKDEGKGTGLGLSMVYGAITQSGGEIDVRSTLGKGSTFSIYLPMCDNPDEIVKTSEDVIKSDHGGKTVMIVEDDPAVLRLSQVAFEESGFHVLGAQNSAQAIELFGELSGRFDLLLVDLELPGISGDELARRFSEQIPNLKIILMSGHAPESLDFKKIIGDNEAVWGEFLQKPFKPAALIKLAGKLLKS
ncbi:MAG: PAS domain S-box protein [Rhodospirillales bacterium]|nr:PAS domain S-box protein [Rhodospirillales bacterium]